MSDYISREALLQAVLELPPKMDEQGYGWLGRRGVWQMVSDFPAADVRPVVRAHWYWDKDGMDWGIGAWRCSACEAMSPMWWNCDRGSPMHKSGHKFCPNCGADMREES